uniref:Hydrophobic seed protein domain-containing protein n=1 Tax=Setaria viridis TaxID=4556 RepID=A0A4U6W5B6_SETVI|nr:hypothetical protein SEVIR_1G007532v2 [Setaria viridis]
MSIIWMICCASCHIGPPFCVSCRGLVNLGTGLCPGLTCTLRRAPWRRGRRCTTVRR